MRRTKRLAALLIAFAMLFTLLPLATAGAATQSGSIVLTMNSTDFTVNGTKTKIDEQGSKPVQSSGYTMLPLRAILEATGGTLTYDADTKKITIVRGGDTVVLTLDSKTAVVNGANRTLGAAPYATNGRTMVHIRTLELFGMRVDWDSKTNNVTVNYIEPTKIYNLTLQNGMGTAYTGVYIAPDGTAAGAAAESGNLLGSDTLTQNGSIIVQAPISTPGNYQLRCTYVDPLSKATQQHIIRNVNLTGITDRATVLMNSATSPSVTVDGASVGNATITLYLLNNTGNTISAVYYRQNGAQYYERTNLLGNQLLSNGGQASCSFTYNTNSPYYDFVASYSTNETVTYSRVQIGANVGSLGFQTLRLGANGTIDGSTTTTTKVETELTFENDSDDTIRGVIFSTSDMTESKWEKADTTFGKISSGSDKSTTIDLSESRRWYVCVLDEDSEYLHSERLDFGSTSVKKATITWDGDELECDVSSTDSDDDDSDGYGGNTDLVLANVGDEKFEDVVVITQDDYDDLSSDTYKKIKAKGISLGSLKAETIKSYADVFKYKEEDYYICFFTDTSEDDYEYGRVEGLNSKSKFVTVVCNDTSSPIDYYYTAEDDDVLFWVSNKNNEKVYFTESSSTSEKYTQIEFGGGDYFYTWGDVDASKVTIENSNDNSKTTSKLSGYDYQVVVVTVTKSSVKVSGL